MSVEIDRIISVDGDILGDGQMAGRQSVNGRGVTGDVDGRWRGKNG